MSGNPKSFLIQAAVLGTIFFWLPLLIRDTGSGMLFLLVIIPLLCVCFSCINARKNGFQWRVPLIAAGWFLCSVPLFYNKTALPYAIVFFLLSCLGQAFGAALRRR